MKNEIKALEKLETLAHETGRSMIQLALAWALTRTNVTSVLIGARNVAQVDQAFDALEMSLPDGAFERLGT